nr:transposase [Rhizobium sp. P007]
MRARFSRRLRRLSSRHIRSPTVRCVLGVERGVPEFTVGIFAKSPIFRVVDAGLFCTSALAAFSTLLTIAARRFFVERLGNDVVRPMARRTTRLDYLVRHLALRWAAVRQRDLRVVSDLRLAMIRCCEPFADTIARRQRHRASSASMIGLGAAIIVMARSFAIWSGE